MSKLKSLKGSKFLGYSGKDVVLSLQHMFAMFGATVTVPMVVGMNIQLALLSAGIGTILFYFLTKRKVPVFLGSSFAFMPGLITVFTQAAYSYDTKALAAMIGVIIAGLIYVGFSFIIKIVGVKKVKKLFPAIVVGPVIIIIGMNLSGSMFWNNIMAPYVAWGSMEAWQTWTTAIITALIIIGVNAFAKPKSFLKVVPIVLGFLGGYIYGMAIGIVNFEQVYAGTASGQIIIFQQAKELWGFWGAWGTLDGAIVGTAVLALVPIALVTFMEHLGDISANSTVCGQDFMVDPGLDKTVLGDGVATIASAMLGGPANTTYGENTAVLAITKNYNPRNVLLAAVFAVGMSLFVPFGEFVSGIPAPVVGGACVVLFGMIAANGLRALVDAKVDFSNTKNMIVVAVTLAVGLGLGAMSLAGSITGNSAFKIGATLSSGGFLEISPLAISTVLAIVLNLVIPNRKEVTEEEADALIDTPLTLVANVVDNDENEVEEVAEIADTTDSADANIEVADEVAADSEEKAE